MPVAIVKSKYETVNQNIAHLLELLKYTPKKNKILLKPNLVNAVSPDMGITTHPLVAEAIIKYLLPKGYEIIIGEGTVVGQETAKAFEKCGYTALAQKYKIKLLDFNTAPTQRYKWKYGIIELPAILNECEYINIAKLKTHMQTGVTLCVKNQKGLLKPNYKKQFHQLNIHEPIKALYQVIKPDLCIIDGILGLEGNGPGVTGKKKKADILIGGYDAMDVDNVACTIMGIEPGQILHLEKRHPEVVGKQIADVKTKFKKANLNFKLLNIRVWNSGCSGCSSNASIALKKAVTTPLKLVKLLDKGVFRRRDIIMGGNFIIDDGIKNALCVGNCSMQQSKKLGIKCVKGCPPTPEQILDAL